MCTLQRAWSERVSPYFFCRKVHTCILIATGLPSFRTPRWTWPIDAAAKGFMSNSNSRSRHLAPNSLTRTFWDEMKKFVITETIRIVFKMSIKSKISACIVEINNYKPVNKISLRSATKLYCQFHLSFFVLCSMCMYVTCSFKIIIY